MTIVTLRLLTATKDEYFTKNIYNPCHFLELYCRSINKLMKMSFNRCPAHSCLHAPGTYLRDNKPLQRHSQQHVFSNPCDQLAEVTLTGSGVLLSVCCPSSRVDLLGYSWEELSRTDNFDRDSLSICLERTNYRTQTLFFLCLLPKWRVLLTSLDSARFGEYYLHLFCHNL